MTNSPEDQEFRDLMERVFPGYEEFALGSVVPSLSGSKDKPMVSLMIVCNDEAAKDFRENEEISAEVISSAADNKKGYGKDLILRFEFAFPVFSLHFFTAVEGENIEQQRELVSALQKIDFFVLWLVDKDKNLLKILRVEWDKEGQMENLHTWQ